MEKKTIAVCGASGQQGGAVVAAALKKDWNIVALTRHPEHPKATELRAKGVKIIKADLLDKVSLLSAFKNVDAVFGITQPWSADYKKVNVDAEIQQGKNIIDACIEINIPHLTLTTAANTGGDYSIKIPHIESKIQIENYLKSTSLPHTILKPASFMDNIGMNFFPIKKGIVRGFTDADAKLPFIATKDIGEIAVIVMQQPENFRQQEINLIADYISGNEIATLLTKIRHGEHFKFKAAPRWLMRLFAKEFYDMRVAFEKYGRPPYGNEFLDAIQHCKKIYPELMSLEQYFLYKHFDTKSF